MILHLSKEQSRTVLTALERYQRDIKKDMEGKPESIKAIAASELFQLDLLVTWFDRQREISGE